LNAQRIKPSCLPRNSIRLRLSWHYDCFARELRDYCEAAVGIGAHTLPTAISAPASLLPFCYPTAQYEAVTVATSTSTTARPTITVAPTSRYYTPATTLPVIPQRASCNKLASRIHQPRRKRSQCQNRSSVLKTSPSSFAGSRPYVDKAASAL